MAATRIVSIIGRQNAGKTTLLVALAVELRRRKFRVMTIKHATHQMQLDTEGKDTWRHFQEGHAERVLLEAPGERVLFERTVETGDPVALAEQYLPGADIVLCEGFTAAHLPKIEVSRRVAGPPLWKPESANSRDWIAMVTDDASFRADFPVFRFSDTSWLVTLGNLAWDQARILAP
ncbi:MAG TPA: molybdopterin-guanine dinucleotide biosynthesis protein B [Gemmatimonadales bacterium]|nr:molybdopterin-guanine dinucleotide biosynthesis protein B [Gemmatimonadales bacterium]